jgi:ZIP family zinc transporter
MSVARKWLTGLAPLVVLALAALLMAQGGVLDFLRRGVPPVEDLSFNEVRMSPGQIIVEVVNGGPDPVLVAQVTVDEAYWAFEIAPSSTIGSLGKATITLPFPWIQDEPHEITLLTSTGLTFSHTIELATLTPTTDARYVGTFTAIGIYVGVIPVAIGLLWLPLLAGASKRWLRFSLALTGGLLVFIAAEAFFEALEVAESVASGFNGDMLVVLGFAGALLLLQSIGNSAGQTTDKGFQMALLVAIGIGLHNMAEGLAIGASYSLGESALSASLVIGFMLHNTTEGLAIVAPIASAAPPVKKTLGLGLIAGVPTIFGALLGGLSYSPLMATLFLSVGSGAVVQVVISLHRAISANSDERTWTPLTAAGLMAGLVIMYGTGLLVAV